MNLYSIQRGEISSKGKKKQPILSQTLLVSIGLVLTILLSSATMGFITILMCLFFAINWSISLESQSKRVYFLPQCSYVSPSSDKINVVYGFSSGYYMWNSAFIGWRGLGNGQIELLACSYSNGKLITKMMLVCKAQNWVFLNIRNKSGKYVFMARTHSGNYNISSIPKSKFLSIYTLFKLFIVNMYPRIADGTKTTFDTKLYVQTLEN